MDEVLLQSARFQAIRQQIRVGTISHAEANLTQNQIRAALLDLLREIETQGQQPAIREEVERVISIAHSKNVMTGNITTSGPVTIGDTTHITKNDISRRLWLLLCLFMLVTFGGAYLWQRNQALQRPLRLKVRVENRSPNPELSAPNATLTLTYGTKSEPKADVTTECLFEGIPANFQGEELHLQFSAKGFVTVDTSFSFDNEAIVLPVRRNGDLATITGIITDFVTGQPLEGVKASIPGCAALTDAAGAFTLRIPPAQQRIAQRIDLFKAGYLPKSTSTPVFPGEVFREKLSKK